jgi:ubiquitin thioesterase OTU1
MIEVRCYYNEIYFNIKISKSEKLLTLKNNIKSNLVSKGINLNESNLNILYGFPPKTINNNQMDNLTLEDLSIFDKESLRIQLIDQKLSNSDRNENRNKNNGINGNNFNVIDYSKYSIKKKDIPADNSCLFNAINFAINQNSDNPEIIRGIISSEIMANPNEYNSGILGKDPDKYCKWIMDKETWGGGIELSILSKFFQIQIGVADIQHITIEYFGNYDKCIYLLYNNIHYDVFYKEENGKITGVFDSNDEKVKNEIMDICLDLQKHALYVDPTLFSIECMQCGLFMHGQNDVVEHTKKTGHINFKEV